MKKKTIIILSILAIALLGAAIYGFIDFKSNGSGTETAQKQLYTCGMHPDIISEEPGDCPICGMKLVPIKNKTANTGEKKIIYWRAPMDPNEIYDHPGKSKMGMDLVPVYEAEAGSEGIVKIDPAVVQNMNIKTVTVEKKDLNSRITTNGALTTDETKESIVTTRVNGWVEKLYVDYTGKKVRKGDKLMEIYSPELVAAQQELLTALSYQESVNNSNFSDVNKSGNELVKNAVKKLQLLQVSDREIERLEKTKDVRTNVTLYAQNSGTVLQKNVIEGQKVTAGSPLLQIADLSKLWLTADIYENELGKIQLGAKTEIKFNYLPGKTYPGKVSFIYPTLDAKSRTVKVRIDVNNSSGELKPEMYANVLIEGKDLGSFPVVPENAVIRSGNKDVIIIALGGGKFKPQQVELGSYSEGYYQVLNGISEGNKIVTSAQFLIDSESNLKAALNQFAGSTSDPAPMPNKEGKDVMPKVNNGEMEMNDSANHQQTDSSMVRHGKINLKKIDKNNDGKVYQDMMDWNVISDEPGRCVLCNMKLKELTLEEAKNNLLNHGFSVVL